MRKDRKKANLPSLNDLIEKFSQEDVIAVMEKEYQSAPAKLIPSSLIDDTPFIKEVVVPESTIDTFAAGLQEKGFYNPLVVRPKGDRYELILGRKRFLGAKKAGILSLPCAIVEVGDEEELLMLLADTRDQRDTNVVEMALICEALQRDFGYTQQTLAELSHQSRSQITNILRILKLPSSIRQSICLGELSYGHAWSRSSGWRRRATSPTSRSSCSTPSPPPTRSPSRPNRSPSASPTSRRRRSSSRSCSDPRRAADVYPASRVCPKYSTFHENL